MKHKYYNVYMTCCLHILAYAAEILFILQFEALEQPDLRYGKDQRKGKYAKSLEGNPAII